MKIAKMIIAKMTKGKEQETVTPLNHAYGVRKFETRLYWHRSLFFWGVTCALFVGWGMKLASEDQGIFAELTTELAVFGISLSGLFISCVWFFTEWNSKSRQKNWDLHIKSLGGKKQINRYYKAVVGLIDKISSVHKIIKSAITAFGLFWFAVSWVGAASLSSTIIEIIPCENICSVNTEQDLLSVLKDFAISSTAEAAGATPVKDQFCYICDNKENIPWLIRALPISVALITILFGLWWWIPRSWNVVLKK